MSTLDQNAHKVENEHLLMWHKTKCKFLAKIPFLKAITTAVLYEEMKQVKTTYVYISHIVVEFLVSKLFYSRLIYCLGVVLLQHHLFYMKVIFCQKFYSVHIVYLFCNFFFLQNWITCWVTLCMISKVRVKLGLSLILCCETLQWKKKDLVI